MIAICAMVLPGISGSTMLLIFGLYVPIIDAIKEFLHEPVLLPVLCILVLGFGRHHRYYPAGGALDNHRSAMVYFIVGLMVGSLYAIVQGPTTLKMPQPALSFATFSWVWFFAGGVLLAGLTALKNFYGA